MLIHTKRLRHRHRMQPILPVTVPIKKIKGATRQRYGDGDGIAWCERALSNCNYYCGNHGQNFLKNFSEIPRQHFKHFFRKQFSKYIAIYNTELLNLPFVSHIAEILPTLHGIKSNSQYNIPLPLLYCAVTLLLRPESGVTCHINIHHILDLFGITLGPAYNEQNMMIQHSAFRLFYCRL